MKKYILLSLSCLLLCACHNNDYTPKPQAYLRIDTPEHLYAPADSLSAALPVCFEVNRCAEVVEKEAPKGEVWVDLKYPRWDGVVFLTYKPLRNAGDLRGQTDTSSRLLEQHYQFTSGIEEQKYEDRENRVYGSVYYLRGKRVASTCQFWLTDSSHHFLRGALYLNTAPNNDSLAPVIDYMQADIEHLVETLRWR